MNWQPKISRLVGVLRLFTWFLLRFEFSWGGPHGSQFWYVLGVSESTFFRHNSWDIETLRSWDLEICECKNAKSGIQQNRSKNEALLWVTAFKMWANLWLQKCKIWDRAKSIQKWSSSMGYCVQNVITALKMSSKFIVGVLHEIPIPSKKPPKSTSVHGDLCTQCDNFEIFRKTTKNPKIHPSKWHDFNLFSKWPAGREIWKLDK